MTCCMYHVIHLFLQAAIAAIVKCMMGFGTGTPGMKAADLDYHYKTL